MAKRKLRIVRESPKLGVCEYSNAQFSGTNSEIQKQFESHKCERQDFSQNAARIVREAVRKTDD